MSDAQARDSRDRQLALLVESALDYAMFLIDPTGIVLTWNAGAERTKGYGREEIVGQHFSVFYTEADQARRHPAEELRVALRDGRYEEEGWRVRKDGSRFWANIVITTIRDESGKLIGFGKVSRDLTARKIGEEQARARTLELEAANQQLSEYQRLVSSVRDYAIFMLDPAGHVLSWNAGAEHLKGYEPEEVIGRHFSTFYTAADRARDHPAHELEIAVREGRYGEEGWRVRKDGSTFWASVTITAVRDEEGRVTGFAKVTRDLSERKRAEDALEAAIAQLQRTNTELDRFASVAAHDMSDPLRTISGFAEILVAGGLPPERATEYSRHILDSGLRLSQMLEGLLAYARAGEPAGGAHRAEVLLVVAQVCADLGALVEERGAEVGVDVPAEAAVAISEHDLRVVVQNLVVNAIKFGDPSGPIVRISARAKSATWWVSVEDNGAGVAPDDAERVFVAFQRTATATGQAGYGLGLATCKRLVERERGQLVVDALPGCGSRFSFSLPNADSSGDGVRRAGTCDGS